MKGIMAFLADNWVVGYSVITAIVIAGYLIYSILLVRSCRRIGYDVGVSGMIPIINIIILIKRLLKGKKLNNKSKILENEELDFDF